MIPTSFQKKMKFLVLVTVFSLLPILGLTKETPDELEDQFVKSTQKVSPAVVKITVNRPLIRMERPMPLPRFNRNLEDREGEIEQKFSWDTDSQFWKQFKELEPKLREWLPRDFSLPSVGNNGTGMIISSDGYILTAYHVVEHAKSITIQIPNGKKYTGELKGYDSSLDVALVKIEARNLPTIELGNSEKVQAGQWAISLGYPRGEEDSETPSITIGHTGGTHRSIRNYRDLIQIDAQVALGYGGGPVVNTRGEVIGLIVAKSSEPDGGIGYAIPINEIKAVMEKLRTSPSVSIKKSWLGVVITDITEPMAEEFGFKNTQGAFVTRVYRGSPADKAGIQTRDVIVRYGNKEVDNADQLRKYVVETPVGEKVNLQIIRKGNKITLTVRIGDKDEAEQLAQLSNLQY